MSYEDDYDYQDTTRGINSESSSQNFVRSVNYNAQPQTSNKEAKLENHPLIKYPKDKSADYRAKYSILTSFLEKGGLDKLLANEDIRAGLRITGGYTNIQIDNLIAKFGEGIELHIKELCADCSEDEIAMGIERNGYTTKAPNEDGIGNQTVIQIDEDLVQELETAILENKQAKLLAVIGTILHESVHYGEHELIGKIPNSEKNKKDGSWERKYDPFYGTYTFYHNNKEIGSSSEGGAAFETGIWYDDDEQLPAFMQKQGEQGAEDSKELIKALEHKKQNDKIPVLPNKE